MSSESHSNSVLDTYDAPRTEASLFTSETNVGLHVGSDLPPADIGRRNADERARLAREEIETELGPRTPSAQLELAVVGSHLADLRAWMSEFTGDGEGDEETRTFREVYADFEHHASRIDQRQQLEDQFSQPSANVDMMGYEPTNLRR